MHTKIIYFTGEIVFVYINSFETILISFIYALVKILWIKRNGMP